MKKNLKTIILLLTLAISLFASEYPAWQGETTYEAGTIVTYNGLTYEAIRNVSVNTPPTTDGGWFWAEYTEGENSIEYNPNLGYNAGDMVTYNGAYYEAIREVSLGNPPVVDGGYFWKEVAESKKTALSTGAEWELVTPYLKNARAIACGGTFNFAISENGKGVYFNPIGSDAFFAVPFTTDYFSNDPVVKAEAVGQREELGGVLFRGLYMVTESGAVKKLMFHRGHWFVENLDGVPGNIVDITISAGGLMYVVDETNVTFEFAHGIWNAHLLPVVENVDIIAIANGSRIIQTGPNSQNEGAMYFLCKNNKKLYNQAGSGGHHGGDGLGLYLEELNTEPVIPSKDVEMVHNLGGPACWGYATFHNNTDVAYYNHYNSELNAQEWINLGECGTIDIDSDSYLWDANENGIFRVLVPSPLANINQ